MGQTGTFEWARRITQRSACAVLAAASGLMLVAPSAGSSTPPTLSWQQAAQRSRFPVYRPRRSSALKPSVVRVSSSGCVNAVWGSVTTGTSPYLILYQPGESVQCGQAGEANQVATAVIHGTKVNVLVQCNRIPHCSVRDGETQGIFILSVPEPGSPHYSVEFQSHHMLLRDLLTVARSLVRVRAAKAPGAPGPGSSHAVPVLGDARAGTAGFGKAQPSLIAEANNPLTEVSSRNTFPDVADPRPEQTLKVVVFPAPFGPMSAVILPVGTSSVTFRAATSPPNWTVTPCTRSPPGDAGAITPGARSTASGAVAGCCSCQRNVASIHRLTGTGTPRERGDRVRNRARSRRAG